MVDNPIDLLIKSQQIAVKLATDTLRTVTNAGVTAVTQPDELVRQVGDLAGAVASMAGAITGIAGATAQPLQDFIVRQRELADTVATLADAQADLAGVVAKLAERHAEAVTALEKVTAPIFTLVGTDPTPPKSRAARVRQSEVATAASKTDLEKPAPSRAKKSTPAKPPAKKAPAKKPTK
ncbi:hypothetical protein F0U44_08625 [Nocardioides humilatus]|uniref:Uncharacterized protein n=1 Tax=Nocardioides humilatus TaxID=2607660 RepID=A0A5B1LD42_9ACTN|nr:hypothetical protein [Nocardioides humilatus]KAA1418562.1 hypothetical protein F0U44_08625 [Nocardioides humilatus]